MDHWRHLCVSADDADGDGVGVAGGAQELLLSQSENIDRIRFSHTRWLRLNISFELLTISLAHRLMAEILRL